jgi:hypothetical protein
MHSIDHLYLLILNESHIDYWGFFHVVASMIPFAATPPPLPALRA